MGLVANPLFVTTAVAAVKMICSIGNAGGDRDPAIHTLSRHKPNSTNASRRNRKYANKLLLDVATDAILVQDLENKILFWNKVRSDWKAQEAKGQRAFVSGHFETEAAQNTIAIEGKWQGELHQVTKSGKEIIVESRWTLVREQEEKPKSILIVNTDITEKTTRSPVLRPATGALHPASSIAHDLNNVLAPILTAQLCR